MKALFILSAALVAAGCATTEPTYLAQKDCKVAPLTIHSQAYGNRKSAPVDSLDRRYAEMQLAATPYRQQQLARNGMYPNNIEEAMRDCDMADPKK